MGGHGVRVGAGSSQAAVWPAILWGVNQSWGGTSRASKPESGYNAPRNSLAWQWG